VVNPIDPVIALDKSKSGGMAISGIKKINGIICRMPV